MRLSTYSLVLLATLAATPRASADAPPMIPVQGYLTDASGAPLDGSFNIRFRVYAAPSGGVPLLEESPSVEVTRGRFVHYLGTEDALDLAIFRDATSLYLGVRVGNDPEATPLVELASIPFAAFAEYCGDARSVDGYDSASLRDFSSLTNVPSSFAPSAHAHSVGDVSGAQAQLQGACPAGSSIRAIDTAGAITCESDDDTIYTSGAGIVVNPDRSISLASSAVQAICYDTEAELHAVLGDDFAALDHTHAATSLTGSFVDLTATGTVTAGTLSAGAGAFTNGLTAASLTVVGTITAETYALSAPRQRRKFVPASEFMATSGNASLFSLVEPYRANLSTVLVDAWASAPVELPHGASISRITCYVTDFNATYDFSSLRISMNMRGVPNYTSMVSIGSSPSTSTSGNVSSVPVHWNVYHTVDALTPVYTLTFSWLGTTTAATQVGILHGCEIVYSTIAL